jgi:hypothetical protein
MSFIVLYQESKPHSYQHATCKIMQPALPTRRFTVFPATEAGLRNAVNEAMGDFRAWIASFPNQVYPPEVHEQLIQEVEQKILNGQARRVK